MKRIILECPILFIFLGMSVIVNAQTFETDYTLLKSKAPIPNTILTSSAQKSDIEIANNSDNNGSLTFQKKQKTFIIQSNYLLDQILKGDLILFNTPLNSLVEQVGNQLMGEEVTVNRTHFFIIKSSAINAFASDRGDIFITLGLLARLKTESELAFVLGHELTHYRLKHSMNTFIQHESLEQNNSQAFRESVDVLLEKSNYSKALELIADEEGVILLEKAGYELQGAIQLLNVLKYAHTVLYQDKIEKKIFETNYFKIDSIEWTKEAHEIEVLKNDDTYATHPNTSIRIEKIAEQFLSFTQKDRKHFIATTKTHFDSLILVSQFELIDVLLKEKNYKEAIYNSICLMKRFPDNVFLQKSFTYGLYGLGQYTLLKKSDKIKEDRSLQGNWSPMVDMFNQFSRKKMGILAVVQCWETYQKYPDDEKIQLMARDMLEDLIIYEVDKPFQYFKKASPDMNLHDMGVFPLSLAFSDYLDDSEFKGIIEDGVKYRKKWLKNEKDQEDYKKIRAKKKKKRKEQLKGKSLGAKKVIAVNPFYIVGKVALRSGVTINYLKSEKRETDLRQFISTTSESLDLETVILDINHLPEENAMEAYNDIQVIQLWGDEFFSNPDYMVATNHNEAITVCDKYGTDNFFYPGVVSFHSSVGKGLRFLKVLLYSRGIVLLTYVLPITMPGAFYLTFKKRNEFYYFFLAFDVRNYNLKLNSNNHMVLKDRNEVVKSNLYWSMTQLKRH